MNWRGFKGAELAAWAIWLGAIWFMAILVAPGLFKWLPKPEAGLVAGRLFYMLSCYSLVTSLVLLALSNFSTQAKAGFKTNALMAGVVAVCVVELLWLHPHMNQLRHSMSTLQGEELEAMRASFGNMHAISSVLYSAKMIGALVWGLGRYTVKAPNSV